MALPVDRVQDLQQLLHRAAVVVEVGGQVLVLGVTPTNVRTLHTLPADTLQNTSPAAPPIRCNWKATRPIGSSGLASVR